MSAVSDWLGLRLLDFISWKFGMDNVPLPIIRYPLPGPIPVNLHWPKDTDAQEALECLRGNFAWFSVGGLKCLERAISNGVVPGVDWKSSSSILSYRLGFRGSAIQDYKGEKENAFTMYWRAHRQDIKIEWVLYEIRVKLRGHE
ncbi:MAG: hypothetical protein AAB586_00650 [Patescibacteria group bacterium]